MMMSQKIEGFYRSREDLNQKSLFLENDKQIFSNMSSYLHLWSGMVNDNNCWTCN